MHGVRTESSATGSGHPGTSFTLTSVIRVLRPEFLRFVTFGAGGSETARRVKGERDLYPEMTLSPTVQGIGKQENSGASSPRTHRTDPAK